MPEIRKMNEIQQGEVHILGTPTNRVIYREGGLPMGGSTGDLLAKKSNVDRDVEWVTPATKVEEDNTKPITSAAVYKEIGNINALLATI